jgi:arylsulfatase A-like enzyme
MTGRYPLRYGLQTLVIPSGHTYGLPTDEWLLPQALKEAGYQTAIVGKWHLGHADPKYWPRQRGFDYQYGPLIGELDYFTHEQHGVVDWYRNNRRVKEKGYTTTLLGNDAVKLITEHDPTVPLYLYLAFNAPHTPYQAPQEYLDQYPNIADRSRRAYAASITAMDDQIGRVVAAHRDRLQRRDLPRSHPPGRLEADLAHAAAAGRRTLQPRAGPVRKDQPRRRASGQGGCVAEARQRAGGHNGQVAAPAGGIPSHAQTPPRAAGLARR